MIKRIAHHTYRLSGDPITRASPPPRCRFRRHTRANEIGRSRSCLGRCGLWFPSVRRIRLSEARSAPLEGSLVIKPGVAERRAGHAIHGHRPFG
eukprot:scaffold3892_cov255-Pinguiococcus_pyrenoidosus.AAC.4